MRGRIAGEPESRRSPLLLDTHAWLWLSGAADGKVSESHRREIEDAGERRELLVSIVSVWEIALLANKQRLRLAMPVDAWIESALGRPELRLVGLERADIVIDSVQLPGSFHADPADRFLVATARRLPATLVTRDRGIIAYGEAGHVRVMAI